MSSSPCSRSAIVRPERGFVQATHGSFGNVLNRSKTDESEPSSLSPENRLPLLLATPPRVSFSLCRKITKGSAFEVLHCDVAETASDENADPERD